MHSCVHAFTKRTDAFRVAETAGQAEVVFLIMVGDRTPTSYPMLQCGNTYKTGTKETLHPRTPKPLNPKPLNPYHTGPYTLNPSNPRTPKPL